MLQQPNHRTNVPNFEVTAPKVQTPPAQPPQSNLQTLSSLATQPYRISLALELYLHKQLGFLDKDRLNKDSLHNKLDFNLLLALNSWISILDTKFVIPVHGDATTKWTFSSWIDGIAVSTNWSTWTMGICECSCWIDGWNSSFATTIDASTWSRGRIFFNWIAG